MDHDEWVSATALSYQHDMLVRQGRGTGTYIYDAIVNVLANSSSAFTAATGWLLYDSIISL